MPGPSRIAIVDDDARVRQSLATLLRSFGLRTATYASASDFLTAREGAADCVIADLQMPGMTGIDLQLALRARDGTRAPPLIIVTAFPEELVRRRAIAAGIVGFFSKPIDADELIGHLRAVIADFDDGT